MASNDLFLLDVPLLCHSLTLGSAADVALREREDSNVAALVAHIDALYEVLEGEVIPSPEAKVPGASSIPDASCARADSRQVAPSAKIIGFGERAHSAT